MQLTADDIHNWSTKYVQARWAGRLTPEQRTALKQAEFRHHQHGTSAQAEAEALNEDFGLEDE